jgi:hypothetical protein
MVEDVSRRFTAWFDEHFDLVGDPRVDAPPAVTCRRCQVPVFHLTKHAAVRHGDQIRIMPMTRDNLGSRSRSMAF